MVVSEPATMLDVVESDSMAGENSKLPFEMDDDSTEEKLLLLED